MPLLKPLAELSNHHQLSDYITAIAWSPVGNALAVSSGAGEVLLLHDGLDVLLQDTSGYSIDDVAFSADGQWLAAGGQAGDVLLWCRLTEKTPASETLTGDSAWIDRLRWHPKRNLLAFNRGKVVQIWDADRAEMLTNLEVDAQVQDIGWSPDGQHIAVAANTLVHIWQISQWHHPRYQWELMAPAMSLSWSPDGAYLATANQDKSVGVLTWARVSLLNQAPTAEDDLPTLIRGFPGKIRQLAWADVPDSDRSPILAAATREFVAMSMLLPDEGWQSWVLDIHNENVLDIAFQRQTGLLASLSEDGWVILWQAAIEVAQVLSGARDGFSCLAWHPTGKRLAAGGQQGEVLVWSVCLDDENALELESM
ncbi:MAG: WD40 repeat domain-containing protein [Thermosynechococcaceae cyanobacterium]